MAEALREKIPLDSHLPPWEATVFLKRMKACDRMADDLLKNHLRHALLACSVLVYTAEYVFPEWGLS